MTSQQLRDAIDWLEDTYTAKELWELEPEEVEHLGLDSREFNQAIDAALDRHEGDDYPGASWWRP